MKLKRIKITFLALVISLISAVMTGCTPAKEDRLIEVQLIFDLETKSISEDQLEFYESVFNEAPETKTGFDYRDYESLYQIQLTYENGTVKKYSLCGKDSEFNFDRYRNSEYAIWKLDDDVFERIIDDMPVPADWPN